MSIGILAVQGAFAEHAAVLDRLGADHFEIRRRRIVDRPLARADPALAAGGAPSWQGCCETWGWFVAALRESALPQGCRSSAPAPG